MRILKPSWIFLNISIAVLLFSLTPSISAGVDKNFPDDGTYREIVVSSIKDCTSLCSADKQCRGTYAEQPDIRDEIYYCRLNNGFGATPLFPSIPPTPLDIQTALHDFNNYRALHGLAPVRLNQQLITASQTHARDLAIHGITSHTGTDGSHHGDRVKRQGYVFSIAAENVASGQKSWEKVFDAWIKSPGHNENLLLGDVTDFGIALVYEPKTTYQTYWAMLVAAPLYTRSRAVSH
jgi:hypothetical protein